MHEPSPEFRGLRERLTTIVRIRSHLVHFRVHGLLAMPDIVLETAPVPGRAETTGPARARRRMPASPPVGTGISLEPALAATAGAVDAVEVAQRV